MPPSPDRVTCQQQLHLLVVVLPPLLLSQIFRGFTMQPPAMQHVATWYPSTAKDKTAQKEPSASPSTHRQHSAVQFAVFPAVLTQSTRCSTDRVRTGTASTSNVSTARQICEIALQQMNTGLTASTLRLHGMTATYLYMHKITRQNQVTCST